MKYKLSMCLLLATLIVAPSVFAKSENSQITETGRIKSFASVNLLSPLNVLNPRIGAGFVYGISNKWKIGIDLGIGNKAIDIKGRMGQKYQLWEIKPELYYFISPHKKHDRYISAELFYINHKDIFSNQIGYEKADYQRYKYGFHLKYGMIFYIAKHFGLNVYTGLGLRTRSNSFTNIVNPSLEKDQRDFYIGNYKDFSGVTNGVDFSLGLKLVVH